MSFCSPVIFFAVFLGFAAPLLQAGPAASLTLESSELRLVWAKNTSGWTLTQAAVGRDGDWLPFGEPSGDYTVLFAAVKPEVTSAPIVAPGIPANFPESYHKYILPRWQQALQSVPMNTAGQVFSFHPENARRQDSGIEFSQQTEVAQVTARWEIDPARPTDVVVSLMLTARREGWFSLASPTLATLPSPDLAWAMVPGYFQGDRINSALNLSYGYGHGLPDRPVVVRERAASTLAPLMTNRAGITLAVVPEPGTAADPWAYDRDTRQVWRLGLSHMDRAGGLSPTLYHPVLGEEGSHLAAGDQVRFRFRYVARHADWFSILKYTAREIYGLPEFLSMKRPTRSLSSRRAALRRYVTDDQTSLWRTESSGSLTLGAQAYNGGVLGSKGDAMKNSDYGAMWMLAKMTADPLLIRDRLPFARNFKILQQQIEPGFFQGAALGQYYLSKSQRFAEEWGDYVEPVALTYYVILDLGNILLFNPADTELRDRLRLGADRLLSWQHQDGHWEVAYDRQTHEATFCDLSDLRPTFYGLLVAYRSLGDEKYLAAARRGADWLLVNAIGPLRFLGVCGDTRFAPDFATAQIAQALLDLYEITGDRRYLAGGIAAARFYATSIFTHPMATRQSKQAGGSLRQDWEINQSGFSFEHGGILGSANNGGPIPLTSHAGLFVRIAHLTGESYFLELARAGAWARDAFVDPKTSVASYYWNTMNRGAGPFPHHAWWQIGWITDYLIAEATYRSKGAISFPRGFFTPKVGPHASYGFAPGKIYGHAAELRWEDVTTSRPEVDSLLTEATDGTLRVILLNNSVHPQTADVEVNAATLTRGRKTTWTSISVIDAAGRSKTEPTANSVRVTIPATGLVTVALQ